MADKVFINGRIYTGAGRRVQALAVKGNRIEAAGTDQEILALEQEGCEVHDLGGKCVLPGFNDTHCHVVLGGLEQGKIHLRGAASVEELVERGRRFLAKNKVPGGAWIAGSGYDHTHFDVPRQPDRLDLDRISTEHPIMIERFCGHIGAANTLALKMTGFFGDVAIEGGGGIVQRGGDGLPTGVLVETALDVFKRRMPKPDVRQTKRAIEAVFREANRYGVTSMQTDDLEGAPFETMMAAYRELAEEGKATVRVWEEIQAARLPALREFLEKGLRTGDGDVFFKIGNIKLITDGSLGARTALLRAGYADDPRNCGVEVYSQEDLDEIVLAAHKAGMQVACHAIGDGAVTMCIHALGEAYRFDGKDLRNRIVHCQFADDAMIREMAQARICADIQPGFQVADRPIVRQRMGEREALGYRWRSMLKAGVRLGGGSDHPVETTNPLWAISCAVNRADPAAGAEPAWFPGECLTVQEAVELYTVGGAVLSLEEGIKGTLEAGKLADFCVLDKDIYEVPEEEIHEIHNCLTVMDGRIVYDGRFKE